MPSRFIAWLDAQPKGRRRLYSGLIALALLTLPFYAAGLALRLLDVGPPPPPVSLATAEATVTASPTIGLRLLPTVAPPPTWTPGFEPDLPEEPEATLDPSLPTVDPALATAAPEASPTLSEVPTLPASPSPAPEATVAPSPEPPSAEPATPEPTTPPEPPGPEPTAIGGFTPQPAFSERSSRSDDGRAER